MVKKTRNGRTHRRAENRIVKAILGGLGRFGGFWGVLDGSEGQKIALCVCVVYHAVAQIGVSDWQSYFHG